MVTQSPASLPGPIGRWLGVDFGEKRIGVAMSDEEGILASAYGIVQRRTDRQAVGQIAALVERFSVVGLVVGEARELDGRRAERADRTRRFAERLRRRTGLPVRLVDETLTSVEAERRLASGTAAGEVDAVAAQVLLQEVLDQERADGGRA